MNIWQDLHRRRIFRLAGLYIVGAWLVIQVGDVMFPAWGIPETAMRYLIIAAGLGFPVALVFGWFFDITAKGIVRTGRADKDDTVDVSLKTPDYLILFALLAISVLVIYGSYQKILQATDELSAVVVITDKPENSIAVLPFQNLSDDVDTEYFSDGITEEILHRLSSLNRLRVIGRASSFAFKNSDMGVPRISNILRVRYLLTGSVRRELDTVRVTASLVDDAGFEVWSESFDRKLEGIFAIQTEIANRVAGQLIKEIITPGAQASARTTTDMDAYNSYLIGRDYLNRRTPNWQENAAKAFQVAIDLDPGFALPYAGFAVVTALSGRHERGAEAQAAVDRALELEPNLAEGHEAQGLLLIQGREPNFVAAESAFRRALELDPGLVHAYTWRANALRGQGRVAEANASEDQGLEIDPLNPVISTNIAHRYLLNGDFRTAEKLYLRQMELPQPPGFAYWGLHELYHDYGRGVEAVYWGKQVIRAYSGSGTKRGMGDLAIDYQRLGMTEQAEYWYNRYSDPDSENLTHFLKRGYLYRLRGDFEAIKTLLENFVQRTEIDFKSIPAFPASVGGAMYVIAGEYQKGIDILAHVYDLDAPPSVRMFASISSYDFVHELVFAYRLSGDEASAERVLQFVKPKLQALMDAGEIYDPKGLEILALNQAMRGDTAGALKTLESATDLGWRNYYFVVNDHRWAEVLALPEFKSLLSKVKADIVWQRSKVEAADAKEDFRLIADQLFPD